MIMATMMLVLVLECSVSLEYSSLSRSYALKAYDCYRPQQAVADFVQWAGCATLTLQPRFSNE